MSVFQKIWHALFPCNLHFKICPFAWLPKNYVLKQNFQITDKFLIHNLAFKKILWHLPTIIFEVRMSLKFKLANILMSRSLLFFLETLCITIEENKIIYPIWEYQGGTDYSLSTLENHSMPRDILQLKQKMFSDLFSRTENLQLLELWRKWI